MGSLRKRDRTNGCLILNITIVSLHLFTSCPENRKLTNFDSRIAMDNLIPEPDLCRRIVCGDERAFKEVFDRFHRKIHRFVFSIVKDKELSDEIVQETFVTFWLHRETLDPAKPFAALLFTIARRAVIDHWRKAAASDSFRERVRQSMKTTTNETEEQIAVNETLRLTEEAVAKLNGQQQAIFTLSRDEGLSYDEIADRLKISRNTVKYHLVNALKTIRTHLANNDVLTASKKRLF